MTQARLRTIEEIFYSALEREPDQIGAFLDKACEGDELLRAELETLLAAYEPARSFIETSAVDLAAKILENTQTDLHAGVRIGHYELCERIGAGGMGEVYLATDITAGRKAALKLLPTRFTGDAERVQRFEQEARAVVALNHPNILTVYEIGEHDSTYYIASELIDGETLRQRLARGPIGASEAVDVAIQVASALQAAHAAGIVHRDIKPENIMLRPDGYVKVLDFGVAKLVQQEVPVTIGREETMSLVETNIGAILGTARYMSPEQVLGAPVGKGADIWSLGVVLYEMLTGRAPFAGNTAKEVMHAILTAEPPPLTDHLAKIPDELQRSIERTLRKKSEERYQSVGEFIDALKAVRRRLELSVESASPWLHRTRLAAALVVALLGVPLLAFYWQRSSPTSSPPEKSIVVLPFENLSDNQQDAYFASGVQDEILTDLAKIADLKVISRTSTRLYDPGRPRNSREIAQQLGVAHLLEGSVQRSNSRLRINAQLIDARTDSHLWAQTYDREVADVFAIQSEIAQTIANQLQAKISPGEKVAIDTAPTKDLAANDLYRRAMALGYNSLKQGIDLLEQAVVRDPHFVRAYCALAALHLYLYDNEDHTAARLQSAKATIEKAAQFQPDSGEVHAIRAHYLSRGLRDYNSARAELELARRALPNDATVYYEAAMMDRRQARWSEALGNFDRAIELDPRNAEYLEDAASCYFSVRRYTEAMRLGQRALALSPHDNSLRLYIAEQALNERADLRPLCAEIDAIVAENPGTLPDVWGAWTCAIYQRDAAAADRALATIPPEGAHWFFGSIKPREWYVGYAAHIFNQPEQARVAFTAAGAILAKDVREQPDHALSWSFLGRVKAMLGDKQEAIAAGQRACQLWPVTNEPLWGLRTLRELTVIYACAGEKDLALQQLSLYAGQPGFVDYGELKLDPDWDPLRGDPRFEKIVASLAPK